MKHEGYFPECVFVCVGVRVGVYQMVQEGPSLPPRRKVRPLQRARRGQRDRKGPGPHFTGGLQRYLERRDGGSERRGSVKEPWSDRLAVCKTAELLKRDEDPYISTDTEMWNCVCVSVSVCAWNRLLYTLLC